MFCSSIWGSRTGWHLG